MTSRRLLGVWLRVGISFALGFLAGIVAEFFIGVKGQTDFAIAVAGGLAIVASCMAAFLPEMFTRARERRVFLREHADLLDRQVYGPVQLTGVTIVGHELKTPDISVGLLAQDVPDWGFRDAASRALEPVSELSNWKLGSAHFETDPTLSGSFRAVWARLRDRVPRKAKLDHLYLITVGRAIAAIYGQGFVPAGGFMTPEPPKWFNLPVIANWLRSGNTGYVFTEQVSGTQHRILGGSMIVLTSDGPFAVPASDFSRVIVSCSDDAELRAAWTDWLVQDSEDQQHLAIFLRLVKHASERIQATHEIPGRCEVCFE